MQIIHRSLSLVGFFVLCGLVSCMVFIGEITLTWVGFWSIKPAILGQAIRGPAIVILLCASQLLVPGWNYRKAREEMFIVAFQAGFCMYLGASHFSYPYIEHTPINLLLSVAVMGSAVGLVPVCRRLTTRLPIAARYMLAFVLIAIATMGSREAMRPFLFDLDKDDVARISLSWTEDSDSTSGVILQRPWIQMEQGFVHKLDRRDLGVCL